MAGIYIHIPFCSKACHYCNFHFSTQHSLLPQMVHAIINEANLQSNYLNENISTIYFGGGTPSLMQITDCRLMTAELKKIFLVNDDAEITLEANPDDINAEKLKGWKDCGINRLSIGVQSFNEDDLIWMNRAHNAKQALQCIELAQAAGFSNISIDLIYGVPGMDIERWKQNVDRAIALNIPHLSCYALTVEPKTALEKMIVQHKKENTNADIQAQHFELLMQWLGAAGYEHYEISNFAKPGMQSRHNSSYWQGKNYLGLGPSAHSYNGESRRWNIANNTLYIKNIEADSPTYEEEVLTETQKLNEYIMTSLRTSEGISVSYIEKYFGSNKADMILKSAAKYEKQSLMTKENNMLKLANKGKLFADGIAAGLFL